MARKNPVPDLGVRFLTATPTNPDAPTVAELTAGVDLRGTAGSEGLAAMAGWAKSGSKVDTPDFLSLTVGNVSGPVTLPETSMDFYRDGATTTIFDALADNTKGWVYFIPDGPAPTATERCEGWQVTVTARNPMNRVNNEAEKFQVSFSVQDARLDGTIAT